MENERQGLLEESVTSHHTLLIDTSTQLTRRLDDLAIGIVLLLIAIVTLFVARYAPSTTFALTTDFTKVIKATTLEQFLLLPLALFQTLFILLSPLLLAAIFLVEKRWINILTMLLSSAISMVFTALTSYFVTLAPHPFSVPLSVTSPNGLVLSISPALAGILTMVIVTGERRDYRMVKILQSLFFVIMIFALLQGRMTLAAGIFTTLAGLGWGLNFRFILGARSNRADGPQLISALTKTGIFPTRIVRIDRPRYGIPLTVRSLNYHYHEPLQTIDVEEGSKIDLNPYTLAQRYRDPAFAHLARASSRTNRVYQVWDEGNKHYVLLTADKDTRIHAWLADLWNNIRIKGLDISLSPTVRRTGEHAALVGALANQSGINTLSHCGLLKADQTMLNLYSYRFPLHLASTLDSLSDNLLEEFFKQLKLAHRAGLAHRNLQFISLAISNDKKPFILHWEEGEAAAGKLTQQVDLVQLLVTLSALSSAKRAVAAFLKTYSESELLELSPLLQNIILPQPLKVKSKALNILPQLQHEISSLAPDDDIITDSMEIRRFSIKTVIFTGFTVIAVIVVLGSFNLEQLKMVLSNAQPGWILLGLVAALSISFSQALTLYALINQKIDKKLMVIAQLAGCFPALVAPSGVGVAALNLRFLVKKGIKTSVALATVTLSQLLQLTVMIGLLIVVILTNSSPVNLSLPSNKTLLGVSLFIFIIGVCLIVTPIRKKLLYPLQRYLKQIWPQLVWLSTQPKRILIALLGCLMQAFSLLMCFYCCVAALNTSGITLKSILITFLISNTLGSTIPTPGGLGPVEAALSGGLQIAGLSAAVSLSIAVLYRVLTLWVRALLGWFGIGYLQRHNHL